VNVAEASSRVSYPDDDSQILKSRTNPAPRPCFYSATTGYPNAGGRRPSKKSRRKSAVITGGRSSTINATLGRGPAVINRSGALKPLQGRHQRPTTCKGKDPSYPKP